MKKFFKNDRLPVAGINALFLDKRLGNKDEEKEKE